MHVLGMAGSKGGTGKSTLGTNLAVAFARLPLRVLIIDCDKQQSISKWRKNRTQDAVDVRSAELSDVGRDVEVARNEGYDLVIVDFPGQNDLAVTAAFKACDLVVIPSAPYAIEINELVVTRRAARAADCSCVMLLVRTTHPSSLRNRHYIEKYPEHFAPLVLRHLVAYADSYVRGEGVVETFPNSVAAHEVSAVRDYLLARIEGVSNDA